MVNMQSVQISKVEYGVNARMASQEFNGNVSVSVEGVTTAV